MKILTAEQVRQWDQFTIEQEPITSLQLMERAAGQCAHWLLQEFPEPLPFHIFCGKGNNGGDGLVIARWLSEHHYPVSVHILEFGHKGTVDFQANLALLHQYPEVNIQFIQGEENLHPLSPGAVVVDAIYGTGLNRPLDGLSAAVVQHLNHSGCPVVSVDLPSGLMADRSSKGNVVIRARHTLSFQCYKPAFLYAENAEAIGELHILDIGLHPGFAERVDTAADLIDGALLRGIYKGRKPFAHKGHFGHALVSAGSHGKMGAAVLAVRAALRGGAGLVTAHIPSCGYNIMQSAAPEAMVITDTGTDHLTSLPEDLSRFNAIGLGPGWGTSPPTQDALGMLLVRWKGPLVLDADALNVLSLRKEWLGLLPPGSILTPHPREFDRLFGDTANEVERAELALQKAAELGVLIVLKGHFTCISTPSRHQFFNSTGNPGMATGGSGDVLTGLLTSLLAQGYTPVEAALLGVYIHGRAGDLAALEMSEEAMLAGDIIEAFPGAFRELRSFSTGL